MKDSDKISRLIFLAFVVDPPEPIPLRDDGTALLSWTDAMELYADAVRREAADVEQLEGIPAPAPADDQPGKGGEPEIDPPADLPELPAAEPAAKPPAAFTGVGSSEKRSIHARLLLFCAAHGPGISGKLAKATNGVLETTQIYDMRNSGRFSLAQWRAVNAAMDWLEQQEGSRRKQNATEEVQTCQQQ